jgi:hypothetical protein
MPRYFFHLVDGEHTAIDEDGKELERCPARPVHRLEEKMGSGWNDELFGETF